MWNDDQADTSSGSIQTAGAPCWGLIWSVSVQVCVSFLLCLRSLLIKIADSSFPSFLLMLQEGFWLNVNGAFSLAGEKQGKWWLDLSLHWIELVVKAWAFNVSSWFLCPCLYCAALFTSSPGCLLSMRLLRVSYQGARGNTQHPRKEKPRPKEQDC